VQTNEQRDIGQVSGFQIASSGVGGYEPLVLRAAKCRSRTLNASLSLRGSFCRRRCSQRVGHLWYA
jgi:hypothetical protein